MTASPLTSLIDECSDVELAAIFEHVWEERGYETKVRFRGPDIHVEAEGETEDGTHRTVRIWIATTRRITADMTSAFARTCDRAGVEPYLAAVGRGRLAPDAHRVGLVELDAASIAVEVRETDTEAFVRGLAGSDEPVARNWLGDPVESSDSTDGNGGDSEGDADDDETLSRRTALKKASQYVVGGFVTYVVVEQISDFVQTSPTLRAELAARRAWLDARLPNVELSTVEWSVPTPQPLYEDPQTPGSGPKSGENPATATTIPYEQLASDPEGYTGTAVTYTGRVDRTVERESERRATVTVEGDDGRLTGDVITRWSTGEFFDDGVGFRLLEGDEIQFWGTVAGSASLAGGPRAPLIDVSALEMV